MSKHIICEAAPVAIKAAETGEDGKAKGPAKFDAVVYTGGKMVVANWDKPVVLDLERTGFTRSLVAKFTHDGDEVGHVTGKAIQDGQLSFSGEFSRVNAASTEITSSPSFPWQASIEADPTSEPTDLGEGETATVNGQEITGPAYIVASELSGFAFLSRGADSNTTVKIAASADSSKENTVDAKLTALVKEFGFDPDNITDDQLATLKANFAGESRKPKPKSLEGDGFAALKAEQTRKLEINQLAMSVCENRHPSEIPHIQQMAENAIEAKQSVLEFKYDLALAGAPGGETIISTKRDPGMSNRVLEAAVCAAGRLDNVEKHYSDQELQAAHDRFPRGISLNQLFIMGAQSNGYRDQYSRDVTPEILAYAMPAPGGFNSPRIQAAGFSTVSIPDVVSNTANKFLMRGWNAIDLTPLSIASVRNVSDFKTITTVSLTGDLTFKKVGAGGEIEHGTLGDETYTNKADTYARMLAITRTDFINDDLGALTDVPMKLGRGAALKLNEIFWTEFLNNSAFFTSGRNNVSTDTGTVSLLGIKQAETIFMDQTDPDSQPLGISPSIWLMPTAVKADGLTLMESEKVKGDTDEPDANPWRGRFRIESSPYMSNSSYTGYSASASYLLADPNDMPVIEIAALNGRVEPTVETADADFNVLGVQMRGYSDVGVNLQEYRGGVRLDGSAAG